jgi:EpsI family protein
MSTAAKRFAAAAALLLFAAIFLQARQRTEIFPKRPPLDSFPHQLGNWTGIDVPLDADTLKILGPGDFLLRSYNNDQESPLDLFIAYFPSQRAGDTIHSPQHCLPGSGWVPIENHPVAFSMPDHPPFPVNRYVIRKGEDRRIVLYWYWAHDRGIASEYWAKIYLVTDSLRMNRSDGALVRITSEMFPGETAAAAEQRLMPFTNSVLPLLNTYIPR